MDADGDCPAVNSATAFPALTQILERKEGEGWLPICPDLGALRQNVDAATGHRLNSSRPSRRVSTNSIVSPSMTLAATFAVSRFRAEGSRAAKEHILRSNGTEHMRFAFQLL